MLSVNYLLFNCVSKTKMGHGLFGGLKNIEMIKSVLDTQLNKG
jgi:hypothetical protein